MHSWIQPQERTESMADRGGLHPRFQGNLGVPPGFLHFLSAKYCSQPSPPLSSQGKMTYASHDGEACGSVRVILIRLSWGYMKCYE